MLKVEVTVVQQIMTESNGAVLEEALAESNCAVLEETKILAITKVVSNLMEQNGQ
jgi:hypothetical protein